jgi:hypothetical protein
LGTVLHALKIFHFIIVTIKLLPKHDLAKAARRTAAGAPGHGCRIGLV